MLAFTKSSSGKWTAPKDPDSREICAVDLSAQLAGYTTTIQSVVVGDSKGTSADGVPFIQGSSINVWVVGGIANGEDNYVTLRYTLANGVRKDITLYFTIKEE